MVYNIFYIQYVYKKHLQFWLGFHVPKANKKVKTQELYRGLSLSNDVIKRDFKVGKTVDLCGY